ncbi:MAG: Ger(x)C family spore germination protein [Clostridia bacterium]
MKKYILIFLILVIMFNGLSSVRELTDLAIVKSIGIDLTENGEIYITAIVADTSKKESTNSGKIYNSTGHSVQEAARNMVEVSPKKLYLGHLEALIISEEIAKSKFENTLDFFIRDNEGSNSFYLFVAKDKSAEEVVSVINNEEIDLIAFLKSTQKYKGSANINTLNDNFKDIIEKGTQLCTNSFEIEGDKLKISEMAYFNEWEMKGFLTSQESLLYNMLMNNTDNFITAINKDDDLIVAEIFDSKTNMSIDKYDSSCININVKINANITETGKNIELNDKEILKEVEKQFNEELNTKIEIFCDKIKEEYKTDILSIGNLLYRKKSELFNDLNYLEKIKVKVNVDFNILSQGGVKKVW